MINTKRTYEDWELAASKITQASNDFYIWNLAEEIKFLGGLDILIQEYIDQWQRGTASMNPCYRITMLSRLFILHAYEIFRTLDDYDCGRRKNHDGTPVYSFRTGRFKSMKQKIRKLRIPLAKIEKAGDSLPSMIEYKSHGGSLVIKSTEGDELHVQNLIGEIYDTLINYSRDPV